MSYTRILRTRMLCLCSKTFITLFNFHGTNTDPQCLLFFQYAGLYIFSDANVSAVFTHCNRTEGEFPCMDGKSCYTYQDICNGEPFCVDYRDEMGCKQSLPHFIDSLEKFSFQLAYSEQTTPKSLNQHKSQCFLTLVKSLSSFFIKYICQIRILVTNCFQQFLNIISQLDKNLNSSSTTKRAYRLKISRCLMELPSTVIQ